MCWRVGSVEDVASGCQMCKLYATKGKCTHERQVCSDRTNHPNFDVRHFVNTDCRFANACGYCKMARANPTVDAKYNRGWPGCCRAPSSHEWEMVKDLGIATMISRLHEIPIPPEVKKRLDANPSPKAVPRPQVQQAEREGGEDRQRTSRSRDNTVASAPQPNASGAATRPQAPRRTATAESALPQSQRPSLAARKSASTVQLMQSLSMAPAPRANFTSSLTSSGSSDSGSNRGGAMSDSDASTVRSEFTDYLSEESEAELQRQAQLRIEAKKEEDEFKAARAKLAGIDTTNPPTDWARSGGHMPTRGGVNVGQYIKSGPQGRPNPPQKGSPPTAAAATSRAPASITEIQRALGGNRPPPAPAVQRQPQQQRA